MTTNSTPKKLTDLRHQDNVVNIKRDEAPETIARKWFKEVFDNPNEPTINKLFKEDDSTVFEAYVDSGSVDYLYIVQS
jgi:hypothetical protein